MADFSERNKRIGQILLGQGIITNSQLVEALDTQKSETGARRKIGTILCAMGFCNEEQIAKALSHKTGFDFVSINDIGVNVAVANLITPEIAEKHKLLPLYQEDKTLYVAMMNPNDIITIDNLKLRTGLDIRPVVAADMELISAIENFSNMNQNLDSFDEEEEEQIIEAEELSIDDKPAVQLVNSVINSAIRAGSSDIHIEALEKTLRVRLRIDGVLQETLSTNVKMMPAVVSRVKVLGGMDIAEKRIPQDGRATVRYEGQTLDIRIATMPTVFGEKIVMRLLRRDTNKVGISDLHFSPRQIDRFNDAVHKPYGFLLVTGPTGSGKSTSLYAVLSDVSTPEKNTITLEDPVERRLSGLNQVQMNNRAGMTFAAALRSVLRSDPDIVMVGEIRDAETAKIAVEAALTGHMVFSTLHTNDAPGAVTRLEEMGVEPFLTASSLVGVLAQRLVRKLCPKCKQALTMSREEMLKIFPDFPVDEHPEDEFHIYKSTGCLTCNNTGYKGRQAVFEFLTVTEEMKRLILDRASGQKVRDLALSQGMRTLKQEGISLMLEGKTSAEEVLRVLI